MKRARRLMSWMAIVLAPAALAQTDDEAFLEELLAVVEESTELAQEDRLNADYVPGMISVLDARRQEALGARTVHEALAWVPGLLTFRAFDGEPFLNVRGVGAPFNSGNVKILVDGVALNRETSGVSSNVLHMPLAQVERIEVVRGPGGVLYGDAAYNGVINIISRREQQLVFARAEEPQAVTFGTVGEWGTDGGATLSWNLSGSQSDAPEVPGDNAGRDRRSFATLAAGYSGFSLELRSVRREFLPNRPKTDEISQALVLAHERSWSHAVDSRLAVTQLRTDHETPGRQYEGRQIKATTELGYRPGPSLQWRFLASLDDGEIDAAIQRGPPMPGAGPPGGPPGAAVRDISRRAWGLGVQAEWAPAEALGVTWGMRYDKRDDIDDQRFTPRLGLVWRAAEQHLFKLQYAEGFRAPTFFELLTPGGQSDLALETIGTTELSYVFRDASRTFRLSAFYSHLDNIVIRTMATPVRFESEGQGYGRGGELEWEHSWQQLRMLANVSYAEAATDRGVRHQPRPDGAATNWLGNLGLVYDLGQAGRFGAHLNYVGERQSNFPGLGDQILVHLSYGRANFLLNGLDLRLGLRNALDEVEAGLQATVDLQNVRDYHEQRGYLDLVYRF